MSAKALSANVSVELDIINKVGERLRKGFAAYGPFESSQPRDWEQEALEEILDGMVYVAKRLVELQAKHAAVLADAERTAESQVQDTAQNGREIRPLRRGDAGGGPDKEDPGAVLGGCGSAVGAGVTNYNYNFDFLRVGEPF